MKAAEASYINRRIHRWLSIAIVVPFLIVVVSGCLLQVKRWIPSLQPPGKTSAYGSLDVIPDPISWNRLLESLRGVPKAKITSWDDVKAIDVRPSLGVARARTKQGYEVQVDLASGQVLSAAPRYSSLLVEIHEGAFFGSGLRNFVFVPAAFLNLLVTFTGIWLLISHYVRKGRRKWKAQLA